jgi:hypothetical protein
MSVRRGALVCVALAAACARSEALRSPSAPDAAGDTSEDAIVGGIPSVASNGVPIPPLALSRTCAHLVRIAPCAGPCPDVTCECAGAPQTFDFAGCFTDGCLTSVSCATTCALGDGALAAVELCSGGITCTSGDDCPFAEKCLVAPGDSVGTCVAGVIGSDCFFDADCQSSMCVTTTPTIRRCHGGLEGEACNLDANCLPPEHCALPAGSFVGKCTSGALNTDCVTRADCQAMLDCIPSRTRHFCSSHAKGAFCETNDQCNDFCVSATCQTGEAGSPCLDASQCHLPFCVFGACSAGAPGDPCRSDADCQMRCSQQAPVGVCTNGADAGAPP